MLATTGPPWLRALRTSDRCPSWRLPIVGTRLVVFEPDRTSRSSAMPRTTCITGVLAAQPTCRARNSSARCLASAALGAS